MNSSQPDEWSPEAIWRRYLINEMVDKRAQLALGLWPSSNEPAEVLHPGWRHKDWRLTGVEEILSIEAVQLEFEGPRDLKCTVQYIPHAGVTVHEVQKRLDEFFDIYAQPTRPVKQQSGAYRAWRAWKLPHDTLNLRALTRDHVWSPGENTVEDPLFRYKGQSSGFYGFLDLSEIYKQEYEAYVSATSGLEYGQLLEPQVVEIGYINHLQWVIGSTVNYGLVRVAEKGLRAEKAIPECLVLSENEDFNLRLVSLADKYKMQLVTLEEAKSMETGRIEYSQQQEERK